MRLRLLIAMLTVCAACGATAETYKWVDKNGKVIFSDTPPPEDAKQVEKRRGSTAKSSLQVPYATKEAMKKHPVSLYANDCGDPCTQAKSLLTNRGIPYTLKNPQASPEDAAELTKLVGALEVPTLVVGKQSPLKGFEAGSWNSILDTAGYPKTSAGVKGELVKDATKERETAKEKMQAAPTQPQAPKGPYADVQNLDQAEAKKKK